MSMHPYSGIKNCIAGSACMRSRRFLPYTLQTDVHVSYVDFSFWKPPPPLENYFPACSQIVTEKINVLPLLVDKIKMIGQCH